MIINPSPNKKGAPQDPCSIFPIWAEEGGALVNGSRQWSFGNGAVGNINLVLPYQAELIAVSFDAEVGSPGTVSINVLKNDVVIHTTKAFTVKDYEELLTGIDFLPGDCIGFQTAVETGAIADSRVAAWFRLCPEEYDGKCFERFSMADQLINNVGAALNPLTYAAGDFASAGFSLSGSNITIQKAGCYDVTLAADFFDNNSARVAHRAIFKVNGVEVSRLSGSNYMRDASAHDDASSTYKDFICVDAGDVFSIDMQATSSFANTTNVTADSRLLIKKL